MTTDDRRPTTDDPQTHAVANSQHRRAANSAPGEPSSSWFLNWSVNRASSAHNRHRWALFGVLLLALGLRLLLWSQPLHQPANDEREYITVARDLLAGRGWQFYNSYDWLRAPLYPLFLAGSLWLAHGDLHTAALPNVLLSVANVMLIYRLAELLGGRRVALLAALIMAVLWTQATFASLYMSETLFTFFFVTGLMLLLSGEQEPRTAEPQNRRQDESCSNEFLRSSYRVPLAPISNLQSAISLSACQLVSLSGVCFGLATLTRSVTLLFLPVVALWLFLREKGRRTKEEGEGLSRLRSFRGLRAGASAFALPMVFLLAATLTITPWTARNYFAYGRFIPVETGLSYNLWYFSEPREDIDTIRRELRAIANPAERSDYATARGLARLREDPAILLRKLWPNWTYLMRVRPIQDRFLQENYKSDVQLPLFTAALLFDDLLYLVIALAGAAGLVLYHHQSSIVHRPSSIVSSPKALCLAWVAYVIGTTLLTHGEARYRHFLFPVLIPFAAWALLRAAPRLRGARQLLVAALWALLLWTTLSTYPWAWARDNLARGWHVLAGDLAWQLSGPQAALASYRQALDAHETPDTWLRLGDALRAMGRPADAREAYENAREVERSYVLASARLGDVLRALGDQAQARRAFVGAYVSEQEMLDWTWRELRPAPRAVVDIGDGLDFGYVGGMYPAEQIQGAAARWTAGRGLVRLRALGAQGVVWLRLAAPRPDGAPVPARVCAAARCWSVQLGPTWRTYAMPFATPDAATFTLAVQSDTFSAPDGRQLGVLVDWVAVARLR